MTAAAANTVPSVDHIKPGQALVNKQNEEKGNELQTAMFRGQIASTSGMMVIFITMLKQALTNEIAPPFYVLPLVLIIGAMCLQFIVGILTLLITQQRNYYSKFKNKGTNTPCFPCCKSLGKASDRAAIKEKKREIMNKILHCPLEHELESGESMVKGMLTVFNEAVVEDKLNVDKEQECVCCGTSYLTWPTYTSTNYVRVLHNMWTISQVALEMKEAAIDQEIKHINDEMATVPSDEKSSVEAVPREQLEQQKLRVEKMKVKCGMLRAQGKVMSDYAVCLEKKGVLKVISAWQASINYLLYVIFVINALITGLGLVEGTSNAALNALLNTIAPGQAGQAGQAGNVTTHCA